MASPQQTESSGITLASARQFVLAAVWALLAFQVSAHFIVLGGQYSLLIRSVVLLALLGVGFSFLSSIFDRQPGLLRNIGLVRRASARAEWATGFALGWAAVVVLLLPMVLARRLHPAFDWSAAAWNSVIASLCMIAFATLAQEFAFRGYPFQRLIELIGETRATILMSLLFAVMHLQTPFATITSTLAAFLAGILFSVAYLRTRALWLPWGMHFGWNVSMALVFGLPIAGIGSIASTVPTQADTPQWFTGGAYGPEASLLAPLVLLALWPVVMRASRDWAWEYNFQPIEGAGYAMDVPPPSEHTKMEAQAKPAPLVQIASSTPQGISKTDEPL